MIGLVYQSCWRFDAIVPFVAAQAFTHACPHFCLCRMAKRCLAISGDYMNSPPHTSAESAIRVLHYPWLIHQQEYLRDTGNPHGACSGERKAWNAPCVLVHAELCTWQWSWYVSLILFLCKSVLTYHWTFLMVRSAVSKALTTRSCRYCEVEASQLLWDSTVWNREPPKHKQKVIKPKQ